MPSQLENLTLGSLALNDQTTWFAEELTIAPPSKRLQRIASPDADSDLLADVERYELRQVTLKLRYVAAAGTIDTALAAINDLSGRLQQAAEIDEGLALSWTPADSTKTGTMYVQSGEITDMPVIASGDDAGWFLAEPVISVRLDCFPFIHGAEYTAATASSSSSRILTLAAADVPGTVPGLGRLVITDTATQNRGHVEIGGERYGYNPSSPSDLDLTAASDLTALAGTLSGSYIGLTANTAPIGIAEARNLPHVGPHNVRAVLERTAAGSTIRARAALQTVDGQWTFTSWTALPDAIGSYDLMLGELSFPAVKAGAQKSTLRIEVTAEQAATVRLYRINPIPTEVVYAVARQRSSGSPSSFDLYDTFDQSAGNLDAPKTANIGGNWAESNRTGANGFQIETTGHTAQRTTVSDASLDGGGCYAVLGSAVAACTVQATVRFSAGLSELPTGPYRFGLLGRYADTNNWAALALRAPAAYPRLSLLKKKAGTVTEITGADSAYYSATNTAHLLRLELDADGTYRCYWQGTLILSGSDPDLATGGALASGKLGLYDAYTSATANTRNYDDFQAPAAPPVNYPLFSGRSCQLAATYAIREASAGTDYAPMPSYRGRRLYIPPAGPADLQTRLVVKDRRTDVDGGIADSADSSRSAALYVTPRFLVAPS